MEICAKMIPLLPVLVVYGARRAPVFVADVFVELAGLSVQRRLALPAQRNVFDTVPPVGALRRVAQKAPVLLLPQKFKWYAAFRLGRGRLSL